MSESVQARLDAIADVCWPSAGGEVVGRVVLFWRHVNGTPGGAHPEHLSADEYAEARAAGWELVQLAGGRR